MQQPHQGRGGYGGGERDRHHPHFPGSNLAPQPRNSYTHHQQHRQQHQNQQRMPYRLAARLASPRGQVTGFRHPGPPSFSATSAGGREIKLVSNAYNIVTANRNLNIHEYELNVQPSPGCRDLPQKVLSRAYVSRSIREILMRNIIPSFLGPGVPRGSVIIDPNLGVIFSVCPLSLYNSHPVPGSSSPNQNEFRCIDLPVHTDLISTLRIDVIIKLTTHYKIHPNNYNSCLLGSIIHHEILMKMIKYGAVYYTGADLARRPHERLDLISCHLLGIALSGSRKIDNDQTLVVINSSHSYITQTHRLIDLLATFLAEKPTERVPLLHESRESYKTFHNQMVPELAAVQVDGEPFKVFDSILNGFKCNALNYKGVEVNLRFDLSAEPASHLLFDEKTTVLDFYHSQGISINYPNLPCLKTRSASHPYYPMEMCSLLAGQKVPVFRLSAKARAHLVLMNKPNPSVTRKTSLQSRSDVAHVNRHQFEAFGVKLSRDPVEVLGCTLHKPVLEYRNQILNPNRDFWESGPFYRSVDLVDNWCVVDTVGTDPATLMSFMKNFSEFSKKFGFRMRQPHLIKKSKQEIMEEPDSLDYLIQKCSSKTSGQLRFVMFIIDSTSTTLNRMIHLAFDELPTVTATCLRHVSILNDRQHRSIYRTLVHKLNARLGGTNHIYNQETWQRLNLDAREIMIVGLDVTHPDNELSGVSIVGCAYTYCTDLFRHKSLVWPQMARKEIITRMSQLMERLLSDYERENKRLPVHIIVYRDGVSHDEFDQVRKYEISKAMEVIDKVASTTRQAKPNLSYIIAQKRHTMRFFQVADNDSVRNPPGGTLIDRGIMHQEDKEFYLYSNTSPQATARPLHYHVLSNGMGLENIQKLTYDLCFNFGKCSSSLSMPSSLRYAHNAAYDARNRVIASREFSENKFYTTKFFC